MSESGISTMRVLTDTDVDDSVAVLDDAWRGEATFAFVPQKTAAGREWVEAALRALPPDLQTDHFALLTSGSTGKPKLVIGQKRRAEMLAQVLHECQHSEPIRRTVVTLPLTYCYAFVNQWLWSRVTGRELVVTAGFSQPDTLKHALDDANDAMLCMVGAQVPLLLQSLAGASFPGVRRLHFAGGRFPQDKLDALRGFFPQAQIYNNYGCAEAMPRLTLRGAEASAVGSNIGRPLPGVELTTDEQDALLFRSPFGSVACVDGGGVRRIAADEWVPTGDLARQGADGTWELLGRASEVFKRYGEKISLPTLQATLAPAWGGQLAFYREIDAAGEEAHVLVLAPHPTQEELRAILRALRANFSRAHWPVRVESLGELPRLANGKIDVMGLGGQPDRETQWRQRI